MSDKIRCNAIITKHQYQSFGRCKNNSNSYFLHNSTKTVSAYCEKHRSIAAFGHQRLSKDEFIALSIIVS